MDARLRNSLHRAQLAGAAPASSLSEEIPRLLYVQFLAQDDYQNFTFLFRLRQPRNNCGNFIEYLNPALHLTAIFRALHGFISNEAEFRLAVSNILKKNHVVHIVYGLMFYSVLRRLNPVSLRRFAYVAVSRASQDAMLFTDNAAQLGPQLAVETSKTAVLDAEQVTSIANAVGMSR